MKNQTKLCTVFLFAAGFAFFACQPRGENGEKSIGNLAPKGNDQMVARQLYHSVGVVQAVDQANGTITIDHEDIPGYLSAMQMTETVADESLLNAVKTGDKVEFEIERANSNIVFTKFNKVGEVALLNGGEIYRANCAECHGANGAGARKGISLVKGHALAHSEAEHIAQVTNGEGGKMPAFKDKLTKEEIAAAVEFVREELQRGATPEQRKSHHH